MTYNELYESAIDKLEKSKITLGEFEKMIEPLNAEIDTDSDTISRAKAIDGKICIRRSNGVEIYDDYVVPVEYLEQLPPAQPEQLSTNLAEVGTDCISREQAIEICDHAIDLLKGQFGAGALVAIKESIEELPPALPEPMKIDLSRCSEENWERIKKEWANTPITAITAEPERINGHWVNGHCDKCNEHAPFWSMASTYHESNFCPNCGADMRGEQDEP